LDGEEILWYGVKTFPGLTAFTSVRETVKQHLARIIDTYQPTVLVVEDPFYAQSTLSRNLKKLTSDLKTWGRWRGLRVESYVPPVVKAYFCRDQRTKQSLAEAMVARYPFLSKYLTVLPWRRRYWFHVFDAVGLGLMCQQKLARRKISL
jgi:Holliday junction resolvasome RuvABC endonuclease subunit